MGADSAVVADAVVKRFGTRAALDGCSLRVPAGRVVGLVGANGSGKSTLLHLLAGLSEPSQGVLTVLGERPASSPDQLARVGFMGQDAPVYPSFRVGEMLRFGAQMNRRWDAELADGRIDQLGIDRRQRAGRLSGGQRAQLALTLAIAKRPELLLLDEPVASLDPKARRQFLQDLMVLAADERLTIVLSSHLLSDVERVCDHLVVLAGGKTVLAGDVDRLLESHRVIVGPIRDLRSVPSDQHVVRCVHTDRQTTMLVRTSRPILDPNVAVAEVGLEELVLAYMSDEEALDPARHLQAVSS